MTPGQQIESQIFAALLPVHGEPMTITRAGAPATVKGLVRRPDVLTDEDKRNVNFALREASIVQLAGMAIAPAIAVGEALVDEDGKTHRVQKILPAPGFLKLVCKVA